MRWMGLDLGEKRIGIALSDPLGLTAGGHSYRKRSTLKADVAFFQQFMADHEVEGVVIGLPLNMNGTVGPAVVKARCFGESLHNATGKPVVFWDERLTTCAAQRLLIEADLSRSKRRQQVDKLAAVLILQNYLDSKSGIKN
ncbi:MAG TPA: Holliday junction resolvase RuvX [Bacillota bacterium]